MELLKQPLKIKNLEISTRLVLPPMATSKSPDGEVTQELVDYYNEKSEGGNIGLIILEHAYVSKDGMANHGQISISKDSDILGLKRISEVIHNNGSKVLAQINHAGSSTSPDITGYETISASAIVNISSTAKTDLIPHEMDKCSIQRIVNCFSKAANIAKEAGFDGIEIHSAHAYLLNQFFSPLTNKRKDEYGGSLNNRIRIHLEIIKEIRKSIGGDFIIALRLGACDYMDGGNTLTDGVEACKAFEKAGVDLLDISGGLCGMTRPDNKEPGYFGELSEAIKKEVSIPVILTGGITEGCHAETLLKEGKADLIGVGRAILKDSKWAKKAFDRTPNENQ